MKPERTKWAWLAAIGIAVLVIATVILVRLGQKPADGARYFTADYASGSRRALFTVTPAANGYRVASGRFDCRPTQTATKQEQFTIAAKTEFRCNDYLLELREKGDTPILASTGFIDLVPPFLVGSGYPVRPKREDVPRYVFRAPGVGVRHLLARPPAACGATPSADAVLCAENGGATGSMLLFPARGNARRLRHGEKQIVSSGDTLWLGYVPFRITSAPAGKVTMRVLLHEDRASWRTMRGERLWQGLELPSYNLTSRDPSLPPKTDQFYSEATRFSKGHLTPERYEPEQEEQLQLLIDHELLCLEATTASVRDGRVVWRPPQEPGCVDYSLQVPARNRRMPPPDHVLRTYQQVQSEDRFGELMSLSAQNLRERVWEIDPTSNLFVFDFHYAATPPDPSGTRDLERVPTALLGVRPRVTATRLRKPEVPFRRPIAFRDTSSSPSLDLERVGADPPLLLLLANRPDGSGAIAPMHVCTVATTGTVQDPVPSSIALGNVTIRPRLVAWSPAGTTGGNDCVQFVRRGTTVTARSLGTVVAARRPASGSPEVLIGRNEVVLVDGDSVRIGAMRFRYRAASDLAATSLPGSGGRVYPFGADAVALLGIGAISNGIEGAMSVDMRTQLAREAQQRRNTRQPEQALRLTIDGDMQRLLSREVNAAFEERVPPSSSVQRGSRAAAVVLDADSGAVLAVANAPRFDPWGTSADANLLLSAMRGEVSDDDTFRTRIQNWAFLRHLAIGSTMKVATSIAMQRHGLQLNAANNTGGQNCSMRLEIALAGGRRVDDFTCTHNNPVLEHGAPSAAYWLPAFYGSCNVYFGGATAMLVPELGPSIFTTGPKATIPQSFDPVALRPQEIEPQNRPGGNSFFETLLLLGYRFDFHDANEAPPQRVSRYRNLEYPTVSDPWLSGLEGEKAFAYPTVPAPELFTNTFRGGEPQLRVPPLSVDGRTFTPQWKSQNWLPHYMALGWGQIMEGSALSIGVSGIPALNPWGQTRSPQIFASRVRAPDPNGPALLNPQQRAVLQSGFSAVIANPQGTAHRELNNTRNDSQALGYQLGGKTGTIQLEKPATRATNADVLSRGRWWGCGVLDFTFTDAEWQQVRVLASRTRAAALAATYRTLPPRGFAAETSECDGLNPGMPRVAGSLSSTVTAAWSELQSLEWRTTRDRQTNSSAFLAAIWPNANHATARRRLIVGITFDLDAAGSKQATRRVARELVRLMAVRRE